PFPTRRSSDLDQSPPDSHWARRPHTEPSETDGAEAPVLPERSELREDWLELERSDESESEPSESELSESELSESELSESEPSESELLESEDSGAGSGSGADSGSGS